MLLHFAKQINHASRKIINEDYDEAIESLKVTWENLKRFLCLANNNGSIMDCYSSSLMGSFEYEFFSSSPSSSSFLKTTVAACSQQYQLEVLIFRDPIMVRGDHFVTHNDFALLDVLQVCEQLYYIATYNLALSYHLKSVQLSQELRQESTTSATSSSSELKKSRQKSYHTCLHVALCLYKQTINSSAVPVIRSMAIISNLGQIHRAFGDHDNADVCKQCLLLIEESSTHCRATRRMAFST